MSSFVPQRQCEFLVRLKRFFAQRTVNRTLELAKGVQEVITVDSRFLHKHPLRPVTARTHQLDVKIFPHHGSSQTSSRALSSPKGFRRRTGQVQGRHIIIMSASAAPRTAINGLAKNFLRACCTLISANASYANLNCASVQFNGRILQILYRNVSGCWMKRARSAYRMHTPHTMRL